MYSCKNKWLFLAMCVAPLTNSCATTSDEERVDYPAFVFLSKGKVAKEWREKSILYRRDFGNPTYHFLFSPGTEHIDTNHCKNDRRDWTYICPSDRLESSTDEIARSIQAKICSKTSDHKLTAQVTAILPSVKPGVPLDIAQNEQVKARNIISKAIKNFFMPLDTKFDEYRPDSSRWRIPGEKPQQVIQYFNSLTFDLDDNASGAAESDLYSFYQIGGKNYLILSSHVAKPAHHVCDPTESGLHKNLKNNEIGCRITTLGEMFYLVWRYSFSPPNEDANPQKMIDLRNEYWEQYIRNYTDVTEVKGGQTDSIKYTVTLNLSRFCEFGVNVDELKSK